MTFLQHHPLAVLCWIAIWISSTHGFIVRTHRGIQTVQTVLHVQSSSNESSDEQPSDLSWLRDAMDTPMEPDGLVLVESQPGISGFAVDPQRGFVVVLVGGRDRATYAVVSPKDKQRVRSPEALCLVQLAGGMDLGTAVLPPDILAKLVAEEIEGSSVRELRPQITLKRVDVVAFTGKGQREEEPTATQSTNNPQRDAAIQEQASKVTAAVQKLPGLEECTQDQVVDALQRHANEKGSVDRQGFMALLDTLRRQINAMETPLVQFNLLVTVNNKEDEELELVIPAPSAFLGVGLALRYKVDVVVTEECQVAGFDVVEIASRFPAFRPIKELYEDAKIMDGFIPSLFDQATAPDNEDKV
ncbi:expressed unknown protein [Seminavis robusta]|uniref:Uncharacterized protein n=1 Tax=Seminavis robusta TaxID=568900 RepID=A0A9N8DM20_9STRA|nr:expressed unknown protein [Seminavis robusta]|eukprot:Sro216_g089550.1 n/a (358) ;mRNA; r:82186-83259